MSEISSIIRRLREEYLINHELDCYEHINSGLCVEFAEEVDSELICGILSNDHFVTERDGSDGWNGDENDVWSEKWIKEYNSYPTQPYTIKDLTEKIQGYHCWMYHENKHYDAECPDGVINFFDLPFFKRYLSVKKADEPITS